MGWNSQVVIANQVIIEGSSAGLFVYNGIPAAGNPPIFAVSTASEDPYGNTVTANAATVAGMPFLVYSAAPALGNMLFSFASSAGVDAFGNVYPSGLKLYNGLLTIADPAAIEFPSGASFEQAIAAISSGVLGSSPAQFIQLLIASANTSTAGAHDKVYAEFNSAAADNSSDANLEFVYQGSNGNSHEYASMDGTGFNILAGLVTAAHPGTTPAVPETRQSAAAGNNWTGTVFYELVATNRVEIVAQLTAPGAAVNGVAIVTLAAGYRPTASGIQFAVGSSGVNAAGDSPTMTLGTNGTLQSTNVSANSTVWIGPIQIPLDL